ncbi:MAG TPA: hypothetical protein VL240_05300 [Candidatus Binatia bacterium]|nr:hypothetical protein [Candidatus Binatia bacterium]
MRYLICMLLGCSLFAQEQAPAAHDPAGSNGSFYVDGIVYQYAAGAEYTLVAAAHSVLNHKFVAVKVRMYNLGQHSATVKPEDIVIEDAVAGRVVQPVTGQELARRMRHPYNMARYGVSNGGDAEQEMPGMGNTVSPQLLEMMRAMAARASAPETSGTNLLYTDTPGALQRSEAPVPAQCDQLCRLRTREAQGADALAQLQRPTSPDYVEQCAFLANTVPPRASLAGVLYYPMGKLAHLLPSAGSRKSHLLHVTASIADETFQFVLPVE